MADLIESASYTAGIYQIETTDPVVGGQDGISNRQAKQLANRTNWLNQNKLNRSGGTMTGAVEFSDGTSDTPEARFTDTPNNTFVALDMMNEVLRTYCSYRGGAVQYPFTFDLAAQEFRSFGFKFQKTGEDGSIGINISSTLGANSLALGDSDTGLRQVADGHLQIMANAQLVADITNVGVSYTIPLQQNGNQVWHAGNLNPSGFLPTSGGTLTNQLEFNNGTSDTPEVTFRDVPNNTLVSIDMLNEVLRAYASYRGAAVEYAFTFDLGTKEFRAFGAKVQYTGEDGSIGINTASALGANSLALGDSDTGLRQVADGHLQIMANGQLVAEITSGFVSYAAALQQGGNQVWHAGNLNPAGFAGVNGSLANEFLGKRFVATESADSSGGFAFSEGSNDTGMFSDADGVLRLRSNAVDRVIMTPDGSVQISGFAGMVAMFARSTPPSGWLKANGAAVSRTVYADLFSVIGTTFGAGDGVNTFNLPDLRGEFLRGWDDARGVDSGRAFSSVQADAMRNITGELSLITGGLTSATGVFGTSTSQVNHIATSVSGTENSVSFDASRVVPTASENRPRNIALLTCIKY